MNGSSCSLKAGLSQDDLMNLVNISKSTIQNKFEVTFNHHFKYSEKAKQSLLVSLEGISGQITVKIVNMRRNLEDNLFYYLEDRDGIKYEIYPIPEAIISIDEAKLSIILPNGLEIKQANMIIDTDNITLMVGEGGAEDTFTKFPIQITDIEINSFSTTTNDKNVLPRFALAFLIIFYHISIALGLCGIPSAINFTHAFQIICYYYIIRTDFSEELSQLFEELNIARIYLSFDFLKMFKLEHQSCSNIGGYQNRLNLDCFVVNNLLHIIVVIALLIIVKISLMLLNVAFKSLNKTKKCFLGVAIQSLNSSINLSTMLNLLEVFEIDILASILVTIPVPLFPNLICTFFLLPLPLLPSLLPVSPVRCFLYLLSLLLLISLLSSSSFKSKLTWICVRVCYAVALSIFRLKNTKKRDFFAIFAFLSIFSPFLTLFPLILVLGGVQELYEGIINLFDTKRASKPKNKGKAKVNRIAFAQDHRQLEAGESQARISTPQMSNAKLRIVRKRRSTATGRANKQLLPSVGVRARNAKENAEKKKNRRNKELKKGGIRIKLRLDKIEMGIEEDTK